MTTIYVTHDQVEAMTLGTRVAVMRDGTVQQVDTPQVLYREPREPLRRRVHRLAVDEPRRRDAHRRRRAFAGFRVPLTETRRPTERSRPTPDPRHPPAGLRRRPHRRPLAAAIEVDVAVVEELGSATHVLFTIEAPPVDVDSVRAASDDQERASLLATDKRAFFTAEVAEGTPVRPANGCSSRSIRVAFTSSILRAGATLRPEAVRDRMTRCGRRRDEPGAAHVSFSR